MIAKFSTSGPNGKFFAHLNKLIDEHNRLQAVSNPEVLTSKTVNGIITKPKGGKSQRVEGDGGVWIGG